MKTLLLFIFLLVSCTTNTTNIKHIENFNDHKVLETNNSIVRVDEPDMNGIVLDADEKKIDYYDLFYKIGVIGLVIFGGTGSQ